MKLGTTLACVAAALLTTACATSPTAPKMKMSTPIPAVITTPDTVEGRIGTLMCNDGFPTDETVQQVYDNLAFQRGVSVFLVRPEAVQPRACARAWPASAWTTTRPWRSSKT
jgi:hypothetical protein